MILTKEKFNEGMSINGSWSNAQIDCFGITRTNNPGWKYQILDKDFPLEAIEKFLSLKDVHVKSSAFDEREKMIKTLWTIFAYTWFGGKLKDYQSNPKNHEGELPLKN